MSLEEFNERIDISPEDSKKGKLTRSGNLIAEIEKWGLILKNCLPDK